MEVTLDNICPELKLLILQYLDIHELLNFSLVSKQWYHFISSDAVWLEKFRLLEVKMPVTEPSVDTSVVSLRSKPKSAVHNKQTFQNISKSLSREQERKIRTHKFMSIHKMKLAFFLNKTQLIYNRLLVKKDITSNPNNGFDYYGEQKEYHHWIHFDVNKKHMVIFKIYHIEGTTRYNFIFLLHFNLPNQWIDNNVIYNSFQSCGNFCLAKVEMTNIIHVFRFFYDRGTFQKIYEMNPPDMAGFNHGFVSRLLLTDSTVVLHGYKFLCLYDLYTGDILSEVPLTVVTLPHDVIFQMHHVEMGKVLLLVKYHTKKFVKEKVLLLNIRSGIVLWNTKLNCLQSFMKLAVSGQFFVVMKHTKTAFYKLSFMVYDLASGKKQYDVPYHPEFLDFTDWYLPHNKDVLIVRSTEDDYFFDLVKQERIHVTMDMKPPPKSDGQVVYESDDSSDADDVHNGGFSNFHSYYKRGPGNTVLLHMLYNHEHEMAIFLVDYRNNRHVLVAKLYGYKMKAHQLAWDKQFHHLIEFYDHHTCGTSIYRLW